jgi:sulfur carrier protein ThiS
VHGTAVTHIVFVSAAFFLFFAPAARAETATIDVMHLPLSEAVAAARSELSGEGRVAQLPSRRLLIINDDAVHIERVRDLLRQLDSAPAQLAVQVNISEHAKSSHAGVALAVVLPGGWARLDANAGLQHAANRRDFMLRTSSGAPGHIEVGEIRPMQQSVRQYLTAHGIITESNLAYVGVTGGFDVQATKLTGDAIRLNIRPWLRRTAANTRNIQQAQDSDRIMVVEAATELTVTLDEQVTLAASKNAANEFSAVLLGLSELKNMRDLTISVRVSKAAN